MNAGTDRRTRSRMDHFFDENRDDAEEITGETRRQVPETDHIQPARRKSVGPVNYIE